ncbi:MAG: haloacid dehalogenase-like hydrolase [Solobacterium sp.]|nr:haloacid dehalogenase-like hydrolase [Solobacterium sp.]
MNVYDWDDTIYRGDSSFDLIFYTFRKRPKSLLNLPRSLVCGILFGLRIMPKKTFKQNVFRMFRYVDDMEQLIDAFISSHLDHVKTWYLDQQKEDDLVISASPEFLIEPFCARVGINHVLASQVERDTGVYYGENCHGKEKVRRFEESYPQGKIELFYSDSKSDAPLANLAEKAFLVKGEERIPWE